MRVAARAATARLALAMLVACAAAFPRTDEASAAIPAHIRRHEAVRVRARPVEGAAAFSLRLRAFGRTFDLDLEPSPLLTADAETITVSRGRARREPSARVLLRGRVAGDEHSSVRLALRGPTVLGSIRTRDETWYLEPLRRFEPDASEDLTLVYRASDVDLTTLDPLACATSPTTATRPLPSVPLQIVASNRSTGAQSLRLLELTLVADAPFFARHGGESATLMHVVTDRVAAFLEQQAGIAVAVARTVVYETPVDDPLTTSTDTYDLLTSLNALRQSGPDELGDGDALHLFTGRELDGHIAGIAYVGSVCRSNAISLSQDIGADLHVLTLLAGHELGHTLGAWHDGESGPCLATPFGHVMWPTLDASAAEALSNCSIQTIAPVVDGAPCVSDATPPGCGDGALGDGEQCDDGNTAGGDCCRSDCRYDASGTSCATDGNACTADVCDGAGACVHPAATGACDDGDACTMDGRCSEGACTTPGAWKPLSSARLKARFGTGTLEDRLQVRAALPAELHSPPTVAGVTLRFLDESGRIMHELAAPAHEWRDRKGTGRRYSFDSSASTALPAAEADVSISLRFAPASAKAKLRVTLPQTDVSFLAGRSGVGLQVLVGDAADGDCGTVLAMYCNGTAERLSCD